MDPNTITGDREELENELLQREATWRQQKAAIHGTLLPENVVQMLDGLHKFTKAAYSFDLSQPLSTRMKKAASTLLGKGASKLGVSNTLDDLKSLAASPRYQGHAIAADLVQRTGMPTSLAESTGAALSVLDDPAKARDQLINTDAEAKAKTLAGLASYADPRNASLADEVAASASRGLPTDGLPAAISTRLGSIKTLSGPALPDEQTTAMRTAAAPFLDLAKNVSQPGSLPLLDRHVEDISTATDVPRPSALDDLIASSAGRLSPLKAAAYKTGEISRTVLRDPTSQAVHDYAATRLSQPGNAVKAAQSAVDVERSIIPHSDGMNSVAKTALDVHSDAMGKILDQYQNFRNAAQADVPPLKSAVLKLRSGTPLNDAEREAINSSTWDDPDIESQTDPFTHSLVKLGSRALGRTDMPTLDDVHASISPAVNQRLESETKPMTRLTAAELLAGSTSSADLRQHLSNVVSPDSPTGQLHSLVRDIRSEMTRSPVDTATDNLSTRGGSGQQVDSRWTASGQSLTASGQEVAKGLSKQVDQLLTPGSFTGDDLARIPSGSGQHGSLWDQFTSWFQKPQQSLPQARPVSIHSPVETETEAPAPVKLPTVDDDGWGPIPVVQPKLLSRPKGNWTVSGPAPTGSSEIDSDGLWDRMKSRGAKTLQSLKTFMQKKPASESTRLVMEPLHSDDFEPNLQPPPAKRGVLARKLNVFGPQSTDKYSVRPGFDPETLEPYESDPGPDASTQGVFGPGGSGTGAFTGASGSTAQYYQSPMQASISAQKGQAVAQAAGMGAMSADQTLRDQGAGLRGVPKRVELEMKNMAEQDTQDEPMPLSKGVARSFATAGEPMTPSATAQKTAVNIDSIEREDEEDNFVPLQDSTVADTLDSEAPTFETRIPESVTAAVSHTDEPTSAPQVSNAQPADIASAEIAVDDGHNVTDAAGGTSALQAEEQVVQKTDEGIQASEDFSRTGAIDAAVARNVKDAATDTGADDGDGVAAEAAADAADDGIGAAVTGLAGIGASIAGVVEGLSAEPPPMPPIPSFSSTNNVNVAASNQPSAVDSALMT